MADLLLHERDQVVVASLLACRPVPGRPLPDLVKAFRTGGAPPPLPWEPEGRAEFNRAKFLNLLGKEWLPRITDVDQRLRSEPPARVADVACGTGSHLLHLRERWDVSGCDLEPAALEIARQKVDAMVAGSPPRHRLIWAMQWRAFEDLLRRFAGAYAAAKAAESALDFEDLQLTARDLLRDHAAIRERESWRFRSVLVDEFQDTNRLQCELIDLLSRPWPASAPAGRSPAPRPPDVAGGRRGRARQGAGWGGGRNVVALGARPY